MRLTGYRSKGFVWQLCSDTRISDVSRHLPVAATQLFMREETTSDCHMWGKHLKVHYPFSDQCKGYITSVKISDCFENVEVQHKQIISKSDKLLHISFLSPLSYSLNFKICIYNHPIIRTILSSAIKHYQTLGAEYFHSKTTIITDRCPPKMGDCIFYSPKRNYRRKKTNHMFLRGQKKKKVKT